MSGAVTGWTGRQFLAWGGACCEDTTRGGLAYTPATGTWHTIPAAPLAARTRASGAWTGKELVVAGGWDYRKAFRDTAAYNPSTGTWRKLPPMPSTAIGWPALWDGREVLFLSTSSARRVGRPRGARDTGFGLAGPCSATEVSPAKYRRSC